MIKPAKPQQGFILVSVLIITLVLTTITVGLLSAAASQYRLSTNAVARDNALLAAEAGVEQTVDMLNQDETFGGYPSAQTFFNNSVQGRGTFTTVMGVTGSGNAKTITSTGIVYRANTNTVLSKRIVKVTAVGTSSAGYSVHTGPGGLILGGTANITNSEVYVNGTISMNGNAKIGTVSQPLNVHVANLACPTGNSPGPTYPQVCTSSQPISMTNNTNIYGTVCATGQTSTGPNNNIQTGNGGGGLQTGCTAPTVTPPTYDKAAQVAAVSTTGSATSNTYNCSGNSAPFTRTWPSNLKLTGNATINGSCDITISGNVYITGDLTLGGSAKLRIANSVGTVRPVIIVDGTIDVGGSSSIIANSSGTGAQFISFKSAASCGSNCTSLSGNDLKSSQVLQTVSIGGSGNMPGMIFQAYWGKITMSGSGNIGSAIGQTVDLSGSGTVIFGTSLSSGARTWAITSYQRLNNP